MTLAPIGALMGDRQFVVAAPTVMEPRERSTGTVVAVSPMGDPMLTLARNRSPSRLRRTGGECLAIVAVSVVTFGCGLGQPDESVVAGSTTSTTTAGIELSGPAASCSIQEMATTAPPSTDVPATDATVPEASTSTLPATSVTEVPTTEAPTPTIAPRVLTTDDTGDDVLVVQEQLIDLGFWLPQISGTYDEATSHAVTAFEKVSGLDRDATMSIEDQQILDRAVRHQPRSSVGNIIEVDIARQVVLVVEDGELIWILDTSTGSRPGLTPIGTFTIYRETDRLHTSQLGQLYRPKYIIGGVAMHGYPEVPPEPASHGCIRLTNDAMDAIWASQFAPIGTPVLIYDD